MNRFQRRRRDRWNGRSQPLRRQQRAFSSNDWRSVAGIVAGRPSHASRKSSLSGSNGFVSTASKNTIGSPGALHPPPPWPDRPRRQGSRDRQSSRSTAATIDVAVRRSSTVRGTGGFAAAVRWPVAEHTRRTHVRTRRLPPRLPFGDLRWRSLAIAAHLLVARCRRCRCRRCRRRSLCRGRRS
jgi:hypothetical protein